MIDVADPVYDDGRVVLYHGDCLDVLRAAHERHGQPDHCFTDPPYSPRVVAGARRLRDDPQAFVPFDLDLQTIRQALGMAGAKRWTIVFCDHVDAANLQIAPPEYMRHIRWGAWVKPDCAPQFNGLCPANGFESIAILHTLAPMHWNSGGKRGVWTCPVERRVGWHPTPKPVRLLCELLEDFTDPGDLVVDPFAGSCNLALACRATGRRCVLIEKDAEYVERAIKHLAPLPADDGAGTPSLFVRPAA